jgi:hypothetical protein
MITSINEGDPSGILSGQAEKRGRASKKRRENEEEDEKLKITKTKQELREQNQLREPKERRRKQNMKEAEARQQWIWIRSCERNRLSSQARTELDRPFNRPIKQEDTLLTTYEKEREK